MPLFSAAPQVADFLDGPQLSKSKGDKKGKKKEGATAGAQGLETPKTPTAVGPSIGGGPVLSAPPTADGSSKPSFSRIASATEPVGGPTGSGSVVGERMKVQIGLKRKAEDDYESNSSYKRR